MINRVSFFILSLVLSLTISFSQAQVAYSDSLRQKAEQGDADAQFCLGQAYSRGRGVPEGYAESFKWYLKAAEQGHAEAQWVIGQKYHSGLGVPQDYTEAAKWYRKAAEQGDADAQHFLGLMYYIGDGVPHDYVQAHKWYNLAASKSEGRNRKSLVRIRGLAAKNMTREQISEAQRLAREWTEQHRQ